MNRNVRLPYRHHPQGLYADCRNEIGVHDLTGREWVSQAHFLKLNENSNESRYELEVVLKTEKARCRALSGYPLCPVMHGIPMSAFAAVEESPKPNPSLYQLIQI